MKQKYDVVQLESWLTAGKPETKRTTAAIVFDDGFLDNLKEAAPILKKYQLPASFYVVTNCIDTQLSTWTYQLDFRFQNSPAPSIQLDFSDLPQDLQTAHFSDKSDRIAFGRKLKPFLKSLSNALRNDILTSVEDQLSDVTIPRIMMNWDQVRELQTMGFHISSHSVSHPLLATIESDTELEHELAASKQKLEEELQSDIPTISYPIGSFDNRVIAASQKAGYQYGLAVEQRFYNTKTDDNMAIPRVELYEESWLKTRMRMNGSLERVKSVIR